MKKLVEVRLHLSNGKVVCIKATDWSNHSVQADGLVQIDLVFAR